MKYVKKPIVIDAVQWFKPGDHPNVRLNNGTYPTGPHFMRTSEGYIDVAPGDWIITGVNGEHFPCKPGVFEMRYEKVEE